MTQHRMMRTLILCAMSLCILSGMMVAPAPASARTTADEQVRWDAPYIPGEVLVGLRLDRLRQRSGGDAAALAAERPLAEVAPRAVSLLMSLSDTGSVAVQISVEAGRERAVIEQLRRDPAVIYAEPNWIVEAATAEPTDPLPVPFVPNDPLYRENQWGLQRIHASRFWSLGLGNAIQVAVIDSGIDLVHPEFPGRILGGKNYVDPSRDPQDDSGHGTHVSGIIAAELNNGVGVAGLAPRVLIDPRKVLDNKNSGTVSSVAQAIREATDAGARIINLSLQTSADSATLAAAIQYASAQGVLLVSAAGNRGGSVEWPAAYPEVIAVAATDRFDEHVYYSNSGPEIDIAAPGGLSGQPIYSTWPANVPCNGQASNGYCTSFGTSMAAAHVTGVAALIWSQRPDLIPAQLKSILQQTARPTDNGVYQVGAGRVDAEAAMRAALQESVQLAKPSLRYVRPRSGDPVIDTVAVRNASSNWVQWRAWVVSGNDWLQIPSAGRGEATGDVRYGQPDQLPLTATPGDLAAGVHEGSINVEATRSNGSQEIYSVPVTMVIADPARQEHLPWVSRQKTFYRWRTPDDAGRTLHYLTDDSSVGVLLPFTYTLESEAADTMQIYADGFVTFPAGIPVPSQPNTCLGDESPAQRAIYAWWADLDPGRGGSVSTFRATDGAFVVEFLNVPAGAAAERSYAVSFQIVVHAGGRVELVYATVPTDVERVTVGMETRDSLLYREVACLTDTMRLGRLPVSGQALVIEPDDLQ